MTLNRRPHGRSRRSTAAGPAALAAIATLTALAALQGAPAASAGVRHHQHAHQHARVRPAATPSHPGWVKYYVVQPPTHGSKEFLYEIAAKTLHDGGLATVIFNLNEGRPQPDGGRLEDPAVIDPGWILVLPASASGPGVHDGPLPAVAAPPTASARPAAPRGMSLATAARARPFRPGPATPYLAAAGAATLIALLLAAALTAVLRRHRKSGAPGKAGEPPAPPGRRPPAPGAPSAPYGADGLPWPDYLAQDLSRPGRPPDGTRAAQPDHPGPSPVPELHH